MRVLVLAQYYDPVPVAKPGQVARWLSARGHEVSVLTGIPNYPSGQLAPGYRVRPFIRERRDGILVRRAFEIPYHGTSAWGRVLNYGSFMLSGSLASLGIRRPDVVYVWHPPLTVGMIASVLSIARGVPFVFDVQDIWPDIALMSGMLSEGIAAEVFRRIESAAYARSARIMVVTDGAKAHLIAKGVPPEKIGVFPHWADDAAFADPSDEQCRWARGFLDAPGRFVVTFAGNLGLVQGLDTVLRAADALRDDPRVAFRIVGDGSDRRRLERKAATLRLPNLRFLGPRPSADMPALFAESGALLVHLRAGPIGELVVPSKTQAYLAAGKPVVMAMSGAAARIVAEAGAGVVVGPDDPEALARALGQLASYPDAEREAMGRRGREYARAHFTMDAVMARIEDLLREAAG